jgi:hypothetical protein
MPRGWLSPTQTINQFTNFSAETHHAEQQKDALRLSIAAHTAPPDRPYDLQEIVFKQKTNKIYRRITYR